MCNIFIYLTIERYKSLQIQLLSLNKPLKLYYVMKSMEMLTNLGNVFVISTAITAILKLITVGSSKIWEVYGCVVQETVFLKVN